MLSASKANLDFRSTHREFEGRILTHDSVNKQKHVKIFNSSKHQSVRRILTFPAVYIYTVLHLKIIPSKKIRTMPKPLCHAGIAPLTLAKPLCHAERTTVLHCAASLRRRSGFTLCITAAHNECAQRAHNSFTLERTTRTTKTHNERAQ